MKKQDAFRGNFKNFKRAVISCSKMCRLKIFVTYRTSNEPSKFGIRFLAIVIWNLEKGKSKKFKNSIFGGSLIVSQTFLQTEFVIDRLGFAHIIHFQ